MTLRGTAVACLLCVLVSGCSLVEERRFVRVVERHAARYPFMRVQDMYKLVHQAAMGSAHAADSLAAVKMLTYEIRTLRGDNQEPMCDPVSPSGDLVRVHLRAFDISGEDLEELAEAFGATIVSVQGSVDRLERYWGYAESAAADGRLPFTVEELQAYFAERAKEGHPAVHHSHRFRTLYRPAYRVIKRKYLAFSC